jgi:hypothetical protein
MPSDPHKDKGPTMWEFIWFWIIIAGISIGLGFIKGHIVL